MLKIPTQVLAVDPGVSTALVLVESPPVGNVAKVLEHETLEWKGIEHFVLGLTHTLQDFSIFYPKIKEIPVVIEKGPPVQRNNREVLEQIDAELRATFPGATWVTPQYWKSTPSASISFPGLDRHCKDAARMGARFLWLRRFNRD